MAQDREFDINELSEEELAGITGGCNDPDVTYGCGRCGGTKFKEQSAPAGSKSVVTWYECCKCGLTYADEEDMKRNGFHTVKGEF